MATGEFRDRVRNLSRRRPPTASLTRSTGANQRTSSSECLQSARPRRWRLRHSRLTTAIADFDAATIDTTHGFCLHVLMGLGVGR